MNIQSVILLMIFFQGFVHAKPHPPSKSIRIALSQAPSTLDPRIATDATGMRVSDLMFQSLVRLDRHLKIRPSLASHWSYKKNTYQFFVPKNIQFSNGQPLSQHDIEYSFAQYKSKTNPFYSAFQIIQSVNVKKNHKSFQITLKLKEHSPTFLQSDLVILKIMQKPTDQPSSTTTFRQIPIGTGAFYLTKQTDNYIHLKVNPFYQKAPLIQEVIFEIIRDDITRYQKMLKQKIDILQSELPYTKLDQLMRSSTAYRLFQNEGLSVNYLLFNLKDSLFRQLPARMAVALGIHREEIIQHQFKNYVTIAHSILNPSNPFFYSPKNVRLFDLQKAKKILQTNQWHRKKITITTSNHREVISYAKILTHQLRKVGFLVDLKSYEWGTFYSDLQRARFQIALLRWVGAFDPDIYRVAFHSSQIPPNGRNRGFYIRNDLDQLLHKGKMQFDIKKRKKIYQKVQQMVHDDAPIIPLWHNTQISLVKKSIVGYYLPINGSYEYLKVIDKK